MGRPNQTQDRLDALLDGRPGEVTDDLAPLLAAAEALRAELADLELDPEVVDRHLEQALDRPATVVTLPVRTGPSSVLRRRLAAIALAAALVLVPATAASAASASALPGQALYPVKRAVEEFRLATVQWSRTREAHERTRLAAKRLAELDKLVQLRMFQQVPSAIRRLDKAVAAANVAVVEAATEEGVDRSKVAAVVVQLRAVAVAQFGELNELEALVTRSQAPDLRAIAVAVQASPAEGQPISVLSPSPPMLAPPDTNPLPDPTTPPPTSSPPDSAPPSSEPAPETTAPTTTTPAPETTAPPTTAPPPTTVASEGSPAGAGSEEAPTSSIGP